MPFWIRVYIPLSSAAQEQAATLFLKPIQCSESRQGAGFLEVLREGNSKSTTSKPQPIPTVPAHGTREH